MAQKRSSKNNLNPQVEDHAFHLLFTNHPIPMWIYDLETLAFLDVNDAALENYGYTRGEFLALTIKDIRPSEDVAHLIDHLKQKRPTLNHSGEWRHRLKNGRLIDVEITTHTLEFEGHKAVLAMTQDITARKQTENALRESEDKFKYFFEHSDVGKSITLLSGEINVNQALCDMLGYTKTELESLKWQEITHPDDVELTQNSINSLLSDGKEATRFTKRFIHKNGSIIWTDLSSALRRDQDRKPLYLMSTLSDITEQKRAEETLKESEKRFATIFRSNPAAIAIARLDNGQLVDVNEAWLEVTGYKRAEVIGHKPLDLNLWVNPEQRKRLVEALQEQNKAHGEVQIRQKLGEIRVLLMSAEMIKLTNKRYLLTMSQDITERRRAEEKLHESEEKYRAVVDKANDSIMIGQDGIIKFSNFSLAAMLGYEISELEGIEFRKIIPPENIGLLLERYQKRLAGMPVPLMYETALLHKNKERIPVEVNASIVPFEGKPADLVIMRNISERKKAEAALLESKLTTESYLNIAAEIIISLDAEWNIMLLNESGHKLLGYEATELIGKNWLETCLPEGSRNEVRQIFEMLRIGQNNENENHENSVLTKNGEERIILWHNTVLKDNNNKFIGILSSGEDITERKEAETAARIALAKYKTLFEYFPLGITITDKAGNILEANPAAEKLLSVPRGEQTQRNIDDSEWRIVHPNGSLMPVDEFASVQALKEKRVVENVEMGIIKPNSSTTWLSVTAAPLPLEKHGVVITYGDITARKRTEDALQACLRLGQFSDLHTLDELLQKTLDEAEALTNSQIGFAHFLEADQKTLELQMWSTNTLKNMCTAEGKGEHYPVAKAGVWAECVYTREPTIHNDYASLPASRRKGLPQGHSPVVRELIVPVLRGDLIVAIFGVGNKPGDYDQSDIEIVLQLANLTWDIVQRKKAEEKLKSTKNLLEESNRELESALVREKRSAHTDMLTGVNNRRSLYELAEHEFDIAVRYHQPLSVMMFDLDYFKKVNDTFGHAVGDQVLKLVTQTVCAVLRSADSIGRYGGEEFVILLPMTHAQQAYPLAERIRESVAAQRVPTPIGDAAVTLSIGIVEINQTSTQIESVDDMIRRADLAMYAAKQAGRNRTMIFDAE